MSLGVVKVGDRLPHGWSGSGKLARSWFLIGHTNRFKAQPDQTITGDRHLRKSGCLQRLYQLLLARLAEQSPIGAAVGFLLLSQTIADCVPKNKTGIGFEAAPLLWVVISENGGQGCDRKLEAIRYTRLQTGRSSRKLVSNPVTGFLHIRR